MSRLFCNYNHLINVKSNTPVNLHTSIGTYQRYLRYAGTHSYDTLNGDYYVESLLLNNVLPITILKETTQKRNDSHDVENYMPIAYTW